MPVDYYTWVDQVARSSLPARVGSDGLTSFFLQISPIFKSFLNHGNFLSLFSLGNF